MLIVYIKNWKDYQNREVKSKTKWVRLPNDFLNTPEAFSLSTGELLAFLYLICEASKANKDGRVIVNREHARNSSRIDSQDLDRAIEKLKSLQLIEIRTTRGSYAEIPECVPKKEKRREEKKENTILAGPENPPCDNFLDPFCDSLEKEDQTNQEKKIKEDLFLEEIYQLYPKRDNTNKKVGIERFRKILNKKKSSEYYELSCQEIKKAVTNYAMFCAKNNVTGQYIKQFSTFASVWSEWINQSVSENHSPAKQEKPKWIQEAQAARSQNQN